jgi:hypothetical protein
MVKHLTWKKCIKTDGYLFRSGHCLGTKYAYSLFVDYQNFHRISDMIQKRSFKDISPRIIDMLDVQIDHVSTDSKHIEFRINDGYIRSIQRSNYLIVPDDLSDLYTLTSEEFGRTCTIVR